MSHVIVHELTLDLHQEENDHGTHQGHAHNYNYHSYKGLLQSVNRAKEAVCVEGCAHADGVSMRMRKTLVADTHYSRSCTQARLVLLCFICLCASVLLSIINQAHTLCRTPTLGSLLSLSAFEGDSGMMMAVLACSRGSTTFVTPDWTCVGKLQNRTQVREEEWFDIRTNQARTQNTHSKKCAK